MYSYKARPASGCPGKRSAQPIVCLAQRVITDAVELNWTIQSKEDALRYADRNAYELLRVALPKAARR
jgi:hypothetical protein